MEENQNKVSLRKSQSWTDPATGEVYPGGNPNAVPQSVPQPQQLSQNNFAQPQSFPQQNISVIPSSNIEVYPNTNVPQALQPGMKYCKYCGQQIPMEAVLCVKCGRQVEQLQGMQNVSPQVVINNAQQPVVYQTGTPKDKWVAFVLAFILGFLGAHRFYEGKIGTGILWLLTGGLFGIGWLVDWITILTKPNPYYV